MITEPANPLFHQYMWAHKNEQEESVSQSIFIFLSGPLFIIKDWRGRRVWEGKVMEVKIKAVVFLYIVVFSITVYLLVSGGM